MPPLRFAVVGLGHFAQTSILPAFRRKRDYKLSALVSGTDEKLTTLGRRYDVERQCDYAEYDALLASGEIDAVYIALPNDLHADAVVRAAAHGVHVLCEKPMAPTEEECEVMIEACARAKVKLMVAYRLHFQPGNLHVVEQIQKGAIGDPHLFSSVFSFQVREGNTRIQARAGAGPLFDIGVYCINAARYVFRDEPVAVQAHRIENPDDPRFQDVEEGVAAILKFPHGRVASFVCSYGATDRQHYEVVGTKGVIEVEEAYTHSGAMAVAITKHGHRTRKRFGKTDQIAAELLYFTRCVREDITPEPGGREGMIDVRIIRAIDEAATMGREVELAPMHDRKPQPSQAISVPPHGEPRTVGGVESPSR
jgi:glucose-fructose oxidoreductase